MLALGMTFIWLVGITDFWLTHNLIASVGPGAESNPLARTLVLSAGPGVLLHLKLASLATFSIVIATIYRRSRPCAVQTTQLALAGHAMLAAWWHVTLLSYGMSVPPLI